MNVATAEQHLERISTQFLEHAEDLNYVKTDLLQASEKASVRAVSHYVNVPICPSSGTTEAFGIYIGNLI